MGMSVGDNSDVLVDINTTPLIDVMLVLLIMFIITIPIQTHAVKLNTPPDCPTCPKPLVPPIKHVLQVFGPEQGNMIAWDGTGVGLAQLETIFQGVAGMAEQPEVHLRPDGAARYETVAQVLASAQRIGVKKIGFVGNEQFVDMASLQ
jgi:biopolymer transport protein ExbD